MAVARHLAGYASLKTSARDDQRGKQAMKEVAEGLHVSEGPPLPSVISSRLCRRLRSALGCSLRRTGRV